MKKNQTGYGSGINNVIRYNLYIWALCKYLSAQMMYDTI